MKKNINKAASPERSKFASEVIGIFCLCLTILLFISMASYDMRDPNLNHVVRGAGKLQNWAGMFGAYVSAFLVDFFGFAAYTPCLCAATVSAKYLFKLPSWAWWRWVAFILLGACASVAGAAWNIGIGEVRGGGLVGKAMYDFSVAYFSQVGSAVIWISFLMLSVQSIGGFSWLQLTGNLVRGIRDSLDEAAERSRVAKDNVAKNPDSTYQPEPPRLPAYQAEQPALAWPGAEPAAANMEAQSRKQPLIKISSSNVSLVLPPAEKGIIGRIKRLFKVMTRNKEIGSLELPTDNSPPWLDDLEHDRIGKTAAGGQKESVQRVLEAQASPKQLPASRPVENVTGRAKQAKADGDDADLSGVIIDEQYHAPKSAEPKPRRAPAKLPGLNLLRPVETSNQAVSRRELEAKGRTLMTCLNDFSIQAELVRITPGPVVTSFELRPAPGVKTSRISGLSDDIALGLKAIAVRIQAPIPGTDTVGIEIPNSVREVVGLRELLASNEFRSAESLLTLALGKDISGVPTTADLAKMPHMLVAGATGTGKSVFLNSVLMSILYKARPEQIKLLLVDPKRIELAVYADLPHLVHPIVTDMSLAKNALDWAVTEMERRYNDIARLGVRNVGAYNEKLQEMGANRPPDLADLEPMPYLVLIIDELADLMLTAGKDVETSIVRLAQLARAAGIHLIIATQRPSVDVVTGLIKANFPCRISFQVTSKHDSRTILDTVGAEHLLGRGDMLFKPAGGRFQRLHGAFVSDEEVATVADYWRKQQPPDYRVDFSDWGSESAGSSLDCPQGGSGDDQKYNEAVEFVRQQGKASISLIQRRFRIGFNSAARIIEQMEQDGIIGPADGSKPRVVR